LTFSGDKLLGGPQAGVAVGRAERIAPMRKHPLFRALRPDKLCLAALVATLGLWQKAPERVPVARMIGASAEGLEARARRLRCGRSRAAPSACGRTKATPRRSPRASARATRRSSPTWKTARCCST
jgi:L-seryl-tRNA(Ser) seleniumtransferase